MTDKDGPDKITLEWQDGPLDFEEHVKSIKTIERLADCSYCKKEFVVDIPLIGRPREVGEVVGIYSCPYCEGTNTVSVTEPITNALGTRKSTADDRKLQECLKGRRRPITVGVYIKKKEETK